MSTANPNGKPELTIGDAAEVLRCRIQRLTAQINENYDRAVRPELLYLRAAVQILDDLTARVFDESTLSIVTAIMTEEPIREGFRATPALIAWLGEHPQWQVSADVGDEMLTEIAWDTDSAFALAAEAFQAFEDGNLDAAGLAFEQALAERVGLVESLEGFFTLMGHDLDV